MAILASWEPLGAPGSPWEAYIGLFPLYIGLQRPLGGLQRPLGGLPGAPRGAKMAILAGYGQIGPWRPFPGVLRPFWPPRGHIGVKKGSKKGSKMASQEPLWEASGRPFWPYMAPQRPFPWVYYRSPWDPLARGLPEGVQKGVQKGVQNGLPGPLWEASGRPFWPYMASQRPFPRTYYRKPWDPLARGSQGFL